MRRVIVADIAVAIMPDNSIPGGFSVETAQRELQSRKLSLCFVIDDQRHVIGAIDAGLLARSPAASLVSEVMLTTNQLGSIDPVAPASAAAELMIKQPHNTLLVPGDGVVGDRFVHRNDLLQLLIEHPITPGAPPHHSKE